MAIVAVIATCNVCGIFPRRHYAVVTRTAAAENLSVVDSEWWYPEIGCVAVLTDFGAVDVRSVFAGCFSAIVAVDAIARDIQVIKIRGQPGDS